MDVGPPLEQHLRDLEARLLEPKVRGAPDDLAILLDDGFVEFSKSGRIYDKDGVVKALQSEVLQPSPRTFKADRRLQGQIAGAGGRPGHVPRDRTRGSWSRADRLAPKLHLDIERRPLANPVSSGDAGPKVAREASRPAPCCVPEVTIRRF
ncbi:MAG: nuclear transport factor 2 family protein [Myxococcota bacterium]|nr:nuclear transport factor 2 family protein [Myxococcota bacterium]